jgi:glycosyltransferase involved in cell wall biosynthesis
MCKNEEKRIEVTLKSVLGCVDSLVIYDTGSTDNTISICKTFATRNKLPLRLLEGDFKDFSTSRNKSLDFADTFEDIDYLLLLDVNDELRGGAALRRFCEDKMSESNTGFLLCQEWWSGESNKYYNIRLIKARSGWRYEGKVHEWIKNNTENPPPVFRVTNDSIVLYQDRTKDDDKSSKRFIRDKEILLKEYALTPNDSRTTFYLAQTCACLHQYKEALKYYKLRSNMGDFEEEVFHSLLRCGEISLKIGMSWYESFIWYIKAYEHSKRVEPLIHIAEYWRHKKEWLLAFNFINIACKLEYPQECLLFVDKHAYNYKRWHLMGIILCYAGYKKEGQLGCLQAIKYADKDIDKNNLKFY